MARLNLGLFRSTFEVERETNLTAWEWEKMDATAFAMATCPERATSPQGKAAPSK